MRIRRSSLSRTGSDCATGGRDGGLRSFIEFLNQSCGNDDDIVNNNASDDVGISVLLPSLVVSPDQYRGEK